METSLVRMDAINARWLALARQGAIIEVSPGQVGLIDSSPRPSQSSQHTDPEFGGWGPDVGGVDLPAKASKASKVWPAKGLYEVEGRDWQVTWLFLFQLLVGILPVPDTPRRRGPGLLPGPITRARMRWVEFLLAYTPEVNALLLGLRAAASEPRKKRAKVKPGKRTSRTTRAAAGPRRRRPPR